MNQMQDWLLARKQIKPDYPALIINGEAISYYRLNWLVHESYVLIQTHIFIKPGDSVAVIMPSSISYVATIYALVRMAAIFVPLNSRQTADELRWQIENTNCSVVICSKETEAKATSLASNKVTVISFDKTTHANVETLTWINPKITEDDDNLVEEIVLSDPLAIIHTSGTSGKPKGAVLTYSNMFYSAMASAYRIGHMPDDKWLCVLPLYHVGGLSILIRAVLYGITVDLRQKFDVDEINHALTHEDITLVSLVPTMLFRLLEARKEAWSPKLRLVLVGGAATTPELVERCKSENIPIATTYGMTEASSQIATTMPEDAIRKVGTVGKPLMFTEVRVVDESGEKQQTGKYGEILVKGPTVMQGYYGDEDATKKALKDGWLHTGDIGYFDEDGDLFLVQRRSDLIVSGGENVYPSEVEAVLRKHPSIKEVAVVGISDAEWGQKVAAAIILENGESMTEAELETYSREHLAAYKIPRIVKFVDALPMTGSGKIQRNGVKDFFAK